VLKRYLSISFTLLATIALTVSAVLPHHHHEGLVCMITEVCDNHDDLDDEHTSHHQADDMNHRNHNCVSESDIFLSSSKEESTCKYCVCHRCDHIHHFPVHYLLVDFLIYEELPVSKPDYGEFIVSYKSIDASQTHGLRAPPCLLV